MRFSIFEIKRISLRLTRCNWKSTANWFCYRFYIHSNHTHFQYINLNHSLSWTTFGLFFFSIFNRSIDRSVDPPSLWIVSNFTRESSVQLIQNTANELATILQAEQQQSSLISRWPIRYFAFYFLIDFFSLFNSIDMVHVAWCGKRTYRFRTPKKDMKIEVIIKAHKLTLCFQQ